MVCIGDKNKLFFEKDIKLKDRTWMFLRVEFPRELTWAVDPLLHYVKDFEPKNKEESYERND